RHTRSKRDWSSDVCSSDLSARRGNRRPWRVLPGWGMVVADNGGVSRDEKNETEDLLSRRMSSGSASAAEKQSPSPLEAGNDPSRSEERRVGREGRPLGSRT